MGLLFYYKKILDLRQRYAYHWKTMSTTVKNFIRKLWKFHAIARRDLPWRNTQDPYKILLSELMLQQTQVNRVLQKYDEFLIKFPNLQSVHKASMTDILRVWKGLGYNRRAYFIKKIADILAKVPKPFSFPTKYEELIKLPGIGQSTDGALVAFCFAKKTGEKITFIETNIRSVFMHEFFSKNSSSKIKDTEIIAKLGQCLQLVEPKDIREFYYALYDYGTHLKSALGKEKTELHKRSMHYAKQSIFKGSVREMRSLILSSLLKGNSATDELFAAIICTMRIPMTKKELGDERIRFDTALARLIKDGSICISSTMSKNRKRDIIRIC
jgi:A/G-specific adenine glycosylase